MIVRYRTRDGASGVDVVVPLVRPTAAPALLVDRGWLATDNSGTEPDDVPAPPAGEVTVTGWVRVDATGDSAQVADRSTRAISSEQIGPALGPRGLRRLRRPRRRGPGPAEPLAGRAARPRQRAALLLRPAVVVLRPAGDLRLRLPRRTTSGASGPRRTRAASRERRRADQSGAEHARRRRAASTPVTNEAAGESRNAADPAELLRLAVAAQRDRSSAAALAASASPVDASSSATRSVPTRPGSSPLTRTPRGPELVGQGLGDHRQPGAQAVGDGQARRWASGRRGEHEGERTAGLQGVADLSARAGPHRGTPTRRPRTQCSSLVAATVPTGGPPTEISAPSSRPQVSRAAPIRRPGVAGSALSAATVAAASPSVGSAAASASALRPEITTWAPVGDEHVGRRPAEAPGSAGDDVHTVVESRSMPSTLAGGRQVVGDGPSDELGAVEVGVQAALLEQDAWVPRCTMRPSSTTRIWSAWRTVESRWAITRLVRPSRAASSARWTAYSDSESRCAVASSRTTTAGALSSSRAIARRCRSPPDSR